jgi:hypothetical protein
MEIAYQDFAPLLLAYLKFPDVPLRCDIHATLLEINDDLGGLFQACQETLSGSLLIKMGSLMDDFSYYAFRNRAFV